MGLIARCWIPLQGQQLVNAADPYKLTSCVLAAAILCRKQRGIADSRTGHHQGDYCTGRLLGARVTALAEAALRQTCTNVGELVRDHVSPVTQSIDTVATVSRTKEWRSSWC